MSIRDQSSFYSAGAEAMKRLAARCGRSRFARIFEDQAQRYLRMAEASARHPGARETAIHIVRAQRPRALPRMITFHARPQPATGAEQLARIGRQRPDA